MSIWNPGENPKPESIELEHKSAEPLLSLRFNKFSRHYRNDIIKKGLADFDSGEFCSLKPSF